MKNVVVLNCVLSIKGGILVRSVVLGVVLIKFVHSVILCKAEKKDIQRKGRRSNKLCRRALKAGLWMMILLLGVIAVNADWIGKDTCLVGTYCDFYALFVNDDLVPITDGNCNLTIRYNGTILVTEQRLNHSGNGYYNITVNGSRTGRYPSHLYCSQGANLTVTDSTFYLEEGFDLSWQLGALLMPLGLAGLLVWLAVYYGRRRGILNLLYRDLAIVLALGVMVMVIAIAQHLINFQNSAGNTYLQSIYDILGTMFYILLVLTFLTFVFLTIEFVMKAVQKGLSTKGEDEGLLEYESGGDDG